VAGLLGFVAFWIFLSANSSAAVTARQPMTLVLVAPANDSDAYALDVRSRIEFLPTFATMLEEPSSPVDVIADPVRGILIFTSTTDNVERARDDIQLAVAQAETKLHAAIGYDQYAFETVGSMRVAASQRRSPSDLIIAFGVGVGTALVAGAGLLRAAARRRIADLDDRPATREVASHP
jgi:hypothetical protein